MSTHKSARSTYSLASSIRLPDAATEAKSASKSPVKPSFFSKLPFHDKSSTLRGHQRSVSFGFRHHKPKPSVELDWMCRGDDLENNFSWPEEGLGENIVPLPEHLERRLSSSATPSIRSHRSTDSSCSSHEDVSEVITPTSSRSCSGLSFNFSQQFPELQTVEEVGSPIVSLAPIDMPTKGSTVLHDPVKIAPLNLQKRRGIPTLINLQLDRATIRKREEEAAIDALNDFFAHQSPSSAGTSSILTSPLTKGSISSKRGDVDFAVRVLPALPNTSLYAPPTPDRVSTSFSTQPSLTTQKRLSQLQSNRPRPRSFHRHSMDGYASAQNQRRSYSFV